MSTTHDRLREIEELERLWEASGGPPPQDEHGGEDPREPRSHLAWILGAWLVVVAPRMALAFGHDSPQWAAIVGTGFTIVLLAALATLLAGEKLGWVLLAGAAALGAVLSGADSEGLPAAVIYGQIAQFAFLGLLAAAELRRAEAEAS